MSEPIRNRYEFVIFFDVEIPTVIPTQATCPA